MYRKALLFEDKDIAKQILQCRNPRQVKSLGRSVKGFDESKWKKYREIIVYQANLLKFTQNQELSDRLLATGDSELVEASPVSLPALLLLKIAYRIKA